MSVAYRLLGPVEAADGDTPLRLGGPKQRALLALLLLHANAVVSDDRLIDELWGEDPPATARNTLQVYVSQLRKALGGALRRAGSGYALDVDPEAVDLLRFERLVAAARGADPPEASTRLREALALWRGSPLGGIGDEAFASVERGRLEELRAAAVEARLDADLALGRHAELVPELESLVGEHPLRERFRAQLMLALYRTGRQAEALEQYRRAREALVEELGIEPGRELQELERAILVQDPALHPPDPEPEAPREVRKTISVVSVARLDAPPDPEAARAQAARELELAERVAARHGGRVEAAADGATIVFGLPAVHEDDPVRAVRAAADLREELGDAAALGVATGDVLAQDATVVAGDAAARALRLAAHARGGEMLVDTATHGLAAHAVEAEELRRPPGSWRVAAVTPGAPGYARREDTALLGRDAELDELRHAFDRVRRERQAHLFTLLGPAGIGKSRLLRELAERLGDDARVLHGRCLAYGEGVTFWPLAEIVRQLVPEPTTERLRELVAGDPEADAIAGRVAGAIGLAEVRSGADAIFWAARRLFEHVAAERPLVVVFDDVQWAEQTLLALVEHVVDWARTAPILVVCLARPEFLEERTRWGGTSGSTTLMLSPLSDAQSRDLVAQLFRDRPLEEETERRVLAAAEGNPLFIEQMSAMVAEEAPGVDHPVPPTIHALLAARLERLPRAEREALERAAVVGRDFWPAAVAELLDRPREELDGALNALVRKLLVAPGESRFRGQDVLRFQHQLVRDVAYESIPKEQRATLHEEVARWLARQAEGREAEVQELLGYHLEQAYLYRQELGLGGWDEVGAAARDHLLAAGRRAASRGDTPAAVGLLERAAALTAEDDALRADVLTDLAESLRDGGDFHRADLVLAEALTAAAASGDAAAAAHARLAQLRIRIATSHDLTAEEIEPVVTAATAVLDEAGDDRRLAKAWYLRAWLAWLGCRAMDAAEASRRSADHARRAGDDRAHAHALHLLVGADLFGPTPIGEAVARCEEVMAAVPAQRRVTASALRAMAGLVAMAGRFDEALELLARDRAILDDLGLRVVRAGASEIVALVHLLSGDPEAAERELRDGYESFERMGEQASLSTIAAMRAHALYAQGRDDDALGFTTVAEEAAARDDLHTHVLWRTARAKLLARAGDVEGAEALARAAVELAARTDFLVMHGNAVADLAEVLLYAGRADDAAGEGGTALALYARKEATAPAEQARRLLESSVRPSRSSSPPSASRS